MSPSTRPSPIKRICVYCGAADGGPVEYAAAARELGRDIARRGITLVYGGGKVGLMGRVADGAIEAGGQTMGVITEELKHRELGHDRLTELRVVETMHQRKMAMAEMADAFVALPGGVGTFDELFEILTWAQLNIHNKPIALLNTAGFWDSMLGFLEHVSREGFLRIDPKEALLVSADPGALLDQLPTWKGVVKRSWPKSN
jgi:uncharacterized protein (TIGR00730 family)